MPPNKNGPTSIRPSPHRTSDQKPRVEAFSCVSSAITFRISVAPAPWSLGTRSVCRVAGVPVKVLFTAKREVLCVRAPALWAGDDAHRLLATPSRSFCHSPVGSGVAHVLPVRFSWWTGPLLTSLHLRRSSMVRVHLAPMSPVERRAFAEAQIADFADWLVEHDGDDSPAAARAQARTESSP